MDEARIDRATNRIQGALDRIEQAAQRAMQADPAGGEQGSVREARVRAALTQLDALIESLER
jgi:hypothetical protein